MIMANEIDPVELAAQALRREAWASPPAVARLRTDVRSGENFLIATSGQLPELFIGSVVIEWGFDVAKEKSKDFHDWLGQNEKSLAAQCPPGVQYRGTYGVFAQSDNSLGEYRTVWAFDSLATMEQLAAEVSKGSDFGKLVQALSAFRNDIPGASRSQQIYHPAATAVRT
jgi:hypothetical protein